MRRFRRVMGSVLGALALAATGVVAAPAQPAQADATCLPEACGKVVNESGVTLKIRYDDSNGTWHEVDLPSGRAWGGWPIADVDQVVIPDGCVADTWVDYTLGADYQIYLPSGRDKLSGWDTYTVNGLSCGDGYVYAWDSRWDADNQSRTYCRWFYADVNWGDNCGGYRNRASSFQNNSSSGNSVNFYFNPSYLGSWACLGPGDRWTDARYNYFSWGPGLPGYTLSINNEVASSKFVRGCGNNFP